MGCARTLQVVHSSHVWLLLGENKFNPTSQHSSDEYFFRSKVVRSHSVSDLLSAADLATTVYFQCEESWRTVGDYLQKVFPRKFHLWGFLHDAYIFCKVVYSVISFT